MSLGRRVGFGSNFEEILAGAALFIGVLLPNCAHQGYKIDSISNLKLHCHTQFCKLNQVLIVCMSRINCSIHTDKKCSQITKCHK
jgi:hypothetical protein